MLTIAQAAQFLRVTPKTLRRWEKQGILTPERSAGNQRRYTEDQLASFTKPSRVSLSPLTPPYHPDGFTPDLALPPLKLFPIQKKIIIGTLASLLVAISAVGLRHSEFPQRLRLAWELAAGRAASTQLAQQLAAGVVLASETGADDYSFNVSVASLFKKAVTVEGNLTAPNILYGIVAGNNVIITGNAQKPTISVTDVTKDLKIFKTVKVGSTEFSAGSTTDTLTLAAGDNITLSTDTDNKKVTIKASAVDVTTSGWTRTTGLVKLTTAADLVNIGSATGSAKLAIEGGGYAGDILTASQSGNLLLKLTNTGLFNLTATGFTAGLKLQNASTVFSGTGAPSDSNGSNGDYYLRNDGTTSDTTIYYKASGTWITTGSSPWQRNSGALSPTNITDDVLVGAIATASATFRIASGTGDITTSGDIAVNGADVTTTGTTATLFNTSATTLSLGGAATTALNIGNGSGSYTNIAIGSGSGTHTINIAGTGATSADTINIGTGGTAADTITIGNNASTTALNFTSGTGSQSFASSNISGTTTSSSFVLSDSALTTGTGVYVNQTSTPVANTATTQNLFNIIYAQGTTANTNGFVGLGVNFTNNPTVAGNTEYAARIQNQVTTNTTDNAVAALLLLDNADTSGTGSTVVTDALRITNSGAIAAGVTNGIAFRDTTIDTGINFVSTPTTNYITGTNFSVTAAGLGTFASNVAVNGGSLTTTQTTGNLFNATATTVNIAGAGTTINLGPTGASGSILMSGGSADTGCTLDGTTGNFTCSGNIAGGSSGSVGFWQRNSGALSPTFITDDVLIGATATSSARLVLAGTSSGSGASDIALTSNAKIKTTYFQLTNGSSTGYLLTSDSVGNASWTNSAATGSFGAWTLTGTTVYPNQTNYDLLVGSTTTTDAIGKLTINGVKTGKTLAVFNETGDQNILTASQSGIPVFNIARVSGTAANGVTFTGSATGNAITLAATGSDTNIPLSIDSKGSSALNLNNNATGDVLLAGGSAATGCTVTNSNGNLTCSGAISTTATTGTQGWWQRNAGALSPSNITDDLIIGAIATASAKFQVFADTGSASMSGTLTVGQGGTIRPQYGPLSLAYKSAPNTWATGITLQDTTGNVGIGTTGPGYKLDVVGGDISVSTAGKWLRVVGSDSGIDFGNSNNIQRASANGSMTFTANSTLAMTILSGGNVGIGTITPTSKLHVEGAVTGKALTIFNETGDQNIFTASQSGIPVFNLARVAGTAANGVTFTPSATGNSVTEAATGSDTNIPYSIDSKGSSALNLNNNATGDVLLAGGSGATGCTVTNSNGNLTCTGNITGSSSGTAGFWTRTSTTLSPATANDLVSVSSNTTTGTVVGLTGSALTTGTVLSTTATQNTAANTAWSSSLFTINNNQATTAVSTGSIAGFDIQFNQNTAIGGNNETAARINLKQNDSSSTDATVASLLDIANNDTATGNQITVTDAVKITGTNITNGINLSGTFATNLITSTNFSVTQAGLGTLADDLAVNGADITTTGTTATLFNTNATTLSLGGAATTALNLGNGSGNYTAINLGSGVGTHIINIAGTGATAADTINIGTGGTGADTITMGNNASTTALNLTSGTSSQTFASSVVSGTTTTSAFVFNANSLTTGMAMYLNSSSITQGKLLDINTGAGNTLTTGTLANITSTATSLTSGGLFSADWTPGSSTTGSGDLFKITIGANGTTTGNLFNVLDGTSSLFSVSEAAITSSLPHAFNAAGDVSIAYDLQFTNQTASFIKSNAPLYIQAGESFENNDLTLQTFGTGAVTVLPAVATTGSPTAFKVIGAAHTTLTLSVEAPDVNINLNRTVQFATGALTTQRAFLIQAPTYGFVGASTLTNAATLGISGAPVKGSNATITNTHGILIQAGAVSTATNAYGLTVNTPTGATNNYAAQFAGGNVGIGTASPLNILDVSGSAATASAMIRNTSTSAAIAGLAIKLSSTTLDTTSRFINFLDLNSTIIGKINAANTTTVAYSTNGTDFGEYFVKDSSSFTPGAIVSASANNITLAPTSYDPRMIGIVSNTAGFVGGSEGDNKVLVGLAGQVAVKIAATSTAISKGDFITSSTVPGKGMKATKPGFVIGKALEDWSPSNPKETIMIYINNIWADPNQQLALDETGNMTISGTVTAADIKTDQISSLETQLTNFQASMQNLEGQIATLSAQLASLQIKSDPAATLAANLDWQISTASGRLVTAFAVQVPELTVAGQLHVGLLTIDDLTSTLSSLLGEITIQGDLAVTGKIRILGDSTGKAVIPAGATSLTINSTAATPSSQIFATPEKIPIVVATESTQSGKLVIRIPTAITSDLKVNWWVIN